MSKSRALACPPIHMEKVPVTMFTNDDDKEASLVFVNGLVGSNYSWSFNKNGPGMTKKV